jgi:CHAT domain-containing protein/tetratricopeptide (TPR) repeat protein
MDAILKLSVAHLEIQRLRNVPRDGIGVAMRPIPISITLWSVRINNHFGWGAGSSCLRAAWPTMLACAVLMPGFAADATPVSLAPGSASEIRLDADAVAEYTVTLPAGTAASVELIQRSGFVDLELRADTGAALDVRTEAGVGGRIEAPLLSSSSSHWTVIVSARKGRGGATLSLRLSDPHPATQMDASKSAAFERYVEAEQLRRANYRETVVTRRAVDIDERTRAAYAAAESQYAAAGDGCGQRRALIGLSRMEVALGNHARGRITAEAALTPDCRGDTAERAQALKTIGMAAAYQADFAASAAAAEQALALYEQTGDRRYQGIVLGNLSEVYMQLGATDRALAAANGALRAAEATTDGQGIVFSRKSIAAIHLARGELANALQDYRRTLTDLTATPYPMIEGETWNDLGIVYHRMADYQESLKAFATAQVVWERMHNRVGAADTLIDRAQTLLELGDMPRAVSDFRRALEIAQVDGLKSAETRALRGLGTASLAMNRMDAARQYFTKSLGIARATGEITAESYALRGIGDVDFRGGRPIDAQRNDRAALKLARDAGDRDGEAATLAQLARDVSAGGDLEAASKDIDEALAITETQRGQINDPSLRTSYFSSLRAYPDAKIDILMRLDERFPGKGYSRAALAAAERARARALQDRFAERSIELSRSVSPELANAERAAEEHLTTAAFQLGRLGPEATADRRRALANAVDASSHALDEARGRVRSANPRYADLVQPAALNVSELQRTQLAGDTAILEYWLGTRQSYLWIVMRDSFRAVRLAPRTSIERLAQDLASLLRAPRRETSSGGFDGLAVSDSRQAQMTGRAAAALAAVIGADVLRSLPRKIVIVADGDLQELPFGILPTRSDGPDLGTTHDLSYLPSITTLKWLRRPAGGEQLPASLAVFASPVIEPPAAPWRETVQALTPLLYSQVEAEAITGLLPKQRVWLALGADASRANVLAADWRRFTMVHFATHAVVDRRRPELSSIVLSLYDSDGRPQDGSLRMNDIYNLDMPVDLVVLSGCDTAVGRAMDSEGVFSLSRAFFYAGARRVVASLWPVEDRATATFMRDFYEGLLVEHMHAAGALRFAQQRLARDNRWASPYYWGGFVLQGDWD